MIQIITERVVRSGEETEVTRASCEACGWTSVEYDRAALARTAGHLHPAERCLARERPR